MRIILSTIIFLLGINIYSQEYQKTEVRDSIMIKSENFNSNRMIQGGYNLLGFVENGKDFEIFNLKDKKKDYMYTLFGSFESKNDLVENMIDGEEPIVEDLEIPITERIVTLTEPENNLGFVPYSLGENKLKVVVETEQFLSMPSYIDNNDEIKKINGDVETFNEDYNNQIDFLQKYYAPKKDLNKAYSVIVFNNSDSIVHIDTQEGWVYMIQEALDEDGSWKPIEYHDFTTICGNSYSSSRLLPNYSVVSKIYVYEGDFQTLLRVKLMTQKKVYLSNQFKGSINKSQFIIPFGMNESDGFFEIE